MTGGILCGGAAAGQAPPRRAFACSDADAGEQADPAWAHGADKDSGPDADPVLRNLHHDRSDVGATADAGSHARGRPPVRCPAKRQVPAR